MPADAIECPLCLGEGKLKRTEVLDRLGVKAMIAVGIPVDSDIEYTVEVTMCEGYGRPPGNVALATVPANDNPYLWPEPFPKVTRRN